jgi:phosphotransferase system  glucose/maltose/N-acetylglucosamine-specific IIC component
LGVKPIETGIMVEIPAAAIMAAQFAREADFFSIGTNDLTQYTLAMDRGHPKLAPKVDGLNPSVLRLIAWTVKAAHDEGKWVGVCGGIASDPQAVPLLIGLGVDELSVSLPTIPSIKAQIRTLWLHECQTLAQRALTAGNRRRSARDWPRSLRRRPLTDLEMPVMWQHAFAFLQKIGKALMLPVSVLPVAGILLGIGSAHFAIFPDLVSNVMAQSGGAIFGIMAIMFAIGVALGLTNNDGVSALAALVGYVVLLATLGVMAKVLGVETKEVMGIASVDTGVFGGIVIGGIAAALFNRYYRISLPPYLGFFSGKRFVPIVTAFAAIGLGIVLSFVWPPIGAGIKGFSHWAAESNPALAFTVYGVIERLLIPFGLHHIWNVPFFFEVGSYMDPTTGKAITGEIQRYIAGDPTAGNMAGGYLFKMWGLPAAAVAIWHSARPENRARIGGIMISAALTAWLTGITEPIEFAFMFVAPVLYLIHALLAGVAYFLCIELGVKHGMTFSHGAIDFMVLYAKSTHGWWLIPLGLMWAAMYYTDFPGGDRQVRSEDAGPRTGRSRHFKRSDRRHRPRLHQAIGAGLRWPQQYQRFGCLHHPAAGGIERYEQGQSRQAESLGCGRCGDRR